MDGWMDGMLRGVGFGKDLLGNVCLLSSNRENYILHCPE